MKFLVDAQLPHLLAIRIRELGHSARHTLDLCGGNRTPDADIAALADREDEVVVTKDGLCPNAPLERPFNGLERGCKIFCVSRISTDEPNRLKEHQMKQKIKDEILDQLLADYHKPEDLTGPDGLFTELKKRLINRVLESELTTHLGYDKHECPQRPPQKDAAQR